MFQNTPCRLVIMRDISDIVKNEYSRSIEKISEIMVASTSHDMRTPLNTILSMMRLMGQRVKEDLELSKWLTIAMNSTNILLFLVNDTLDYFQIKSGKFKHKFVNFRLEQIISQCFELVQIQMDQKKIEKQIEIDNEISDLIFNGDKDRLNQVLINLVSNALKFTFQGFIRIKVELL